ncbi:MAG TPA: hypothetical protein V6C81_30765 [Planktothrix sp.]|jgi:hypothetical protein
MTGDSFDSIKLANEDQRAASAALSSHVFSLGLDDWKSPAIAGGVGLLGGGTLTGLGEIGLVKVAEPVFKPLVAVGLGMMGGGQLASDIMRSPATTSLEALQSFGPKPLVIGGLIGAAATVGLYEGYKWLTNKA